jgi:hypothetical protein
MLCNWQAHSVSINFDGFTSCVTSPPHPLDKSALNHQKWCVRRDSLKLFLFTACYQMFSQYRLGMIGRAHPAIFMEQHNVTHCEYFMNLHFNPPLCSLFRLFSCMGIDCYLQLRVMSNGKCSSFSHNPR